MKGRVILLEHLPGLHRAALVVDGRLEALELDLPHSSDPQPGAVYRARVTELMPAMGAAFLALGGGAGFLPDAAGVAAGEKLIVQIRRGAEEGKAARAARDIQLPGRFMVFTPHNPGINVSRKLADAEERTRLTAALQPFAEAGGFVLRTHAAGVGADVLTADAAALIEQWRRIQSCASGLAHPGPTALKRLRIALKGDSVEIIANKAAAEALGTQPHTTSPDPFDDFDIEPQITALTMPRVDLREGWISIEPTAALVAVDVNTGSAKSGEAARRVNLAAAEAVPRHLALRRLGGTVLLDFAAAPKDKAERHRLEKTITRAAAGQIDGLRVLGWGPAGLLELRCPRPARSLADLLSDHAAKGSAS